MIWEPTTEEIEEKLIALAYLWGAIEESTEDIAWTPADVARTKLAEPIRKAFRVEVIFDRNDWNDPCTYYVLFYDVTRRQIWPWNPRLPPNLVFSIDWRYCG